MAFPDIIFMKLIRKGGVYLPPSPWPSQFNRAQEHFKEANATYKKAFFDEHIILTGLDWMGETSMVI